MVSFNRPSDIGINYRHQACSNLQFSFVSQTGFAAFDFRQRQFGTAVGSTSLVSDAIIGPAIRFRSGLTNDAYTYANRATLSSPATIAVIAILNDVTGNNQFFQNSNSSNGIGLVNQTAGTFQLVARAVAVLNPTIAVSTGIPYLLVGSMGPNFTVNMLQVRLDTGLVTTATSTNASGPATAGGAFVLGNNDIAARSAAADISAVLFSNTYLSLGSLNIWAQDPWGPWRVQELRQDLMTMPIAPIFQGQYGKALVGNLSATPVSMMRATKFAGEVLLSQNANMQASKFAAEVLESQNPNLQASHFAVEVLRSTAPYIFPVDPKNKTYRRR